MTRPLAIDLYCGLKEGFRAVRELARSSLRDQVARDKLGTEPKTYASEWYFYSAMLHFSQTLVCEQHLRRGPPRNFRSRLEGQGTLGASTRSRLVLWSSSGPCVYVAATFAYYSRHSSCETPRGIFWLLLSRIPESNNADCCFVLWLKTSFRSARNLFARKTSGQRASSCSFLSNKPLNKKIDRAAFSRTLCRILDSGFFLRASIGYAT